MVERATISADALTAELRRYVDEYGTDAAVRAVRLLGQHLEADAELSPGDRVGPYRVLRPLGRGGMGRVYLAEQDAPFHRNVALKVARGGVHAESLLLRFALEREALGRMQHPNIAAVFDAGVTPSGQPYLAMEAVDAVPITDYCEQRRLSVSERLSLLIPVCRAIEHAHRRGVLHRDLKPSNILVSHVDGEATPKVIDFGLAKGLGSRLTDETMATDRGFLLGTLEYMSPEQANQSDRVDTRTDVYALGVTAYQLLTGRLPYDPTVLLQGSLTDILRMICESQPVRPSASVAETLADRGAPLVDRQRIRGDLETILLKALEKDPERRYQSPSALADDLERFLQGRPIQAHPAGRWYSLRKFVLRNKVLTSMAVALVAIAGAAGFAAWRGVGAERQRLRAELARQAAESERSLAEATGKSEAAKAEAVKFAFWDIIARANPGLGVAPDTTVSDFLDMISPRISVLFADYPLIEAALLNQLGLRLRDYRKHDRALQHLRRAYDLRYEHAGPEHPETLVCLVNLALCAMTAEDIEGAESAFITALAVPTEGPVMPERWIGATKMLAHIRRNAGDLDIAIALMRSAVVAIDTTLETTPRIPMLRDIQLPMTLGNWLLEKGDVRAAEEAERLYRSALERMSLIGDESSVDRALLCAQLTRSLVIQGRCEEAERLCWEECVSSVREHCPEGDPNREKIERIYRDVVGGRPLSPTAVDD